jgi:hypothetical protein
MVRGESTQGRQGDCCDGLLKALDADQVAGGKRYKGDADA